MPYIVDRVRTLVVGDLMARRVVELSPQDSWEDAAKAFASHDLSSAPVVDEQGVCVGMLSAADFLKPNVADQFKDATSGDRTVQALMTTAVQSVAPDTPLLHVAKMMSVSHIHHLPVIEDEKIVGVVSTLDIVAAIVNAADEWDAR